MTVETKKLLLGLFVVLMIVLGAWFDHAGLFSMLR